MPIFAQSLSPEHLSEVADRTYQLNKNNPYVGLFGHSGPWNWVEALNMQTNFNINLITRIKNKKL